MKLGFSPLFCVYMLLLFVYTSIYCQTEENYRFSLYTESIMRLTMDNSSRIKAAKHKLESAQFNFKLFESEFTQFTPYGIFIDIFGESCKFTVSTRQCGRSGIARPRPIPIRSIEDMSQEYKDRVAYIQIITSHVMFYKPPHLECHESVT